MQIETTTACNAKCKMCPREVATRSTHSERMDEDVFWSAIDQAHNELGVGMVLPFIDGEPLADSRMVGFVEGIATRYPKLTVGWYTNASLLTAEKAERLLSTRRIPEFNVSMQGGDKATYEATMGLPWERTIENVERLIEINNRMGKPSRIRANMCVFSPTSASAQAFKERWEAKGAMVCLGAFANFGGLGKDNEGEAPWRGKQRYVCDRGTKHLYVFWNGDMGQCCFDLVGSVAYGNLKHQRMADIVMTEKYQKMRAAHFAINVKEMPRICWECNACKFHG